MVLTRLLPGSPSSAPGERTHRDLLLELIVEGFRYEYGGSQSRASALLIGRWRLSDDGADTIYYPEHGVVASTSTRAAKSVQFSTLAECSSRPAGNKNVATADALRRPPAAESEMGGGGGGGPHADIR